MNNEYMNKFIEACQGVMDSFGVPIKGGEVVLRVSPFVADSIVVVIGITGDLHGQALVSMEQGTACFIASIMMGGMPVTMNEVTKSAIAELCNMIIGNAVTLLSQIGIMLDITPPSVLTGENMYVSTTSLSMSIPIYMQDGQSFEFSISAKEIDHV